MVQIFIINDDQILELLYTYLEELITQEVKTVETLRTISFLQYILSLTIIGEAS